jgi:signal transduction histidine kinase
LELELPSNPLGQAAHAGYRPDASSTRRLYYLAALLCIALAAAAIATASWIVKRENALRIAAAERSLLAADAHGVRIVALADALIMQVLWALDGRDPARFSAEQLAAIRHTAQEAVPGPFTLEIWRADATSPIAPPEANVSEREDFRYQVGAGRLSPERVRMIDVNRQLFITSVLPGTLGGDDTVYVTRPIIADDDSATGMVSVGIPVQNFIEYYLALLDREGDRIVLYRNDGAVIARYPAVDPPGTDEAPGPDLWRTYPHSRTGRFLHDATASATTLSLFVGLEPLPLVVVYRMPWRGLDPQALLAYWPVLAIAATTLLAAAVYAWMSIRYAEALSRSNAELARTRDGLRTEAKGRGIFVANMNHELRTPLNAIVGFAQILADGLFGPLGHPKYREYARDIIDSGRHLLVLIGDIIDFSSIDVGSRELESESIDVDAAIDEIARLLRPLAGERGISLETSARGLRVRGDAIAVRQVLMNLVSNAIKFSRADAVVRLASRADGPDGSVVLSVADQGAGISPEDLPSIGRPFYRTRASREALVPGTGLGLSISTALAHRMGGRLTLESTPGIGTTVTLRMPPGEATAAVGVPARISPA